MIGMLSMSLLLIGGGTVYFNMVQFENKQNDNIREKVQSVVNELENHLGYEQELNSNWHNNRFANLDELLGQLANVFYTDINLYDLDGRLLATSRAEKSPARWPSRRASSKNRTWVSSTSVPPSASAKVSVTTLPSIECGLSQVNSSRSGRRISR